MKRISSEVLDPQVKPEVREYFQKLDYLFWQYAVADMTGNDKEKAKVIKEAEAFSNTNKEAKAVYTTLRAIKMPDGTLH